MTTGAVWLVVFSLVVFIVALGISWWVGLLDDAQFDPTAVVVLGLLFGLVWLMPTLVAWVTWAHYS